MLLAMVEAPVGVDAAMDSIGHQRLFKDVQDLALLLDHRDDRNIGQNASVPGLAAALGVEGSAIQDHGGAASVLTASHDGRVELQEIGVVVVEAHCHQRLAPAPPSITPKPSCRDMRTAVVLKATVKQGGVLTPFRTGALYPENQRGGRVMQRSDLVS